MKSAFGMFIFVLLLNVSLQTNAQNDAVNFDDRNETINLTNQALLKINEGNPQTAISILIDAISVDSTFRGAYTTLYRACITAKNYSPAIIDNLKKANRIFIDDDEISFYLGELYRMNNDNENALLQFSKSIDLSKVNGEDFDFVYLYYFNRGNCYLKNEQFQLAIEDYSYSLKLKPLNVNVYTNRGYCYYKTNQIENACNDWGKVSELGSSISLQYLKKFCK